jgi:hypothetical protein
MLNTLEEGLCRGGQRRRQNHCEILWKLCQEGIERVHRVHRENSLLSSEREKIESLKIRENYSRRASSRCKECTEELF